MTGGCESKEWQDVARGMTWRRLQEAGMVRVARRRAGRRLQEQCRDEVEREEGRAGSCRRQDEEEIARGRTGRRLQEQGGKEAERDRTGRR
jgi:hypothetical protein